MSKTIAALYSDGEITLLEDVSFKKGTFKLTVNVPDEVLEDATAIEQKSERREARMSDSTRGDKRTDSDHSIKDLKLDSAEIEQAIIETFGIWDSLELIEKLRW